MAILDTSDAEVQIQLACQSTPLVIPSERQTCKIATTGRFGEALFIDGSLQSTKSDEHIYHEMLVHSLFAGLQSRNRVLILGGAEGCTLREVLKWHDVTHVTQVDWDESLVGHFRNDESWNGGAYRDSRVTVVCNDAIQWLDTSKEMFDAVIVDLCDPSDEKSANLLMSCIDMAKHRLQTGGGFAINCGDCTRASTHEMASKLKFFFMEPRFQRIAAHVFVPSFFSEWCLLFAVPRLWSNTLHDTRSAIPNGLKRFSLSELQKAITWPSDAPRALADFWKAFPEEICSREAKKLDVERYYEEEAEYWQYGC